uniref:Uncharacterized protein n=1 Tax=Avena sativa TaxID=4498 RepID=A0ACD5Z1S7_AVESA
MDYTAAAPPAADSHPAYAHPYAYPYTYPVYHQPDPAAAAAAAASSSSYYYANPTDTQAQYNPYATYQYYGAQAVDTGGSGLAEYYFTAGEASHAPAVSAAQVAPAATGRQAEKNFGFDPQRYAQVAAAKAPNGMAPAAAATVMNHAQWNAHFGHPLPRNATRKFIKKTPNVPVQPLTCEVCKIQCDTMDVLVMHKTGKKHKKNLNRLQDAITPKPANPPNIAVGANPPNPAVGPNPPNPAVGANPPNPAAGANPPNTAAGASTAAAAAVAGGVLPVVQRKKNKSSTATRGDLEVKKRRVLDAGAAQGEVKICAVCNVVVNSQKVYEFHISGHKHKAKVQKQQRAQLQNVA